jgi:hypothetical protein
LVGTHNMRTYDVYPYIYIFLFFLLRQNNTAHVASKSTFLLYLFIADFSVCAKKEHFRSTFPRKKMGCNDL